MSRHELPPTTAGHEVVVGWDPPMNSFYAQVFDRTKDEDDPASELVWIGCSFGEIHDPQKVIDAVRQHAVIPDGLHAALYGEAHA